MAFNTFWIETLTFYGTEEQAVLREVPVHRWEAHVQEKQALNKALLQILTDPLHLPVFAGVMQDVRRMLDLLEDTGASPRQGKSQESCGALSKDVEGLRLMLTQWQEHVLPQVHGEGRSPSEAGWQFCCEEDCIGNLLQGDARSGNLLGGDVDPAGHDLTEELPSTERGQKEPARQKWQSCGLVDV